jgi:hypothetical protein
MAAAPVWSDNWGTTARIDAVQRRFQLNGVFGHEERKTIVALGNQMQAPLIFDPNLFGFVNEGLTSPSCCRSAPSCQCPRTWKCRATSR